MAYSNYLIKVLKKDNEGTDYVIPMTYVLEKTYSMTYSMLESEAGSNAKGKLVRSTLPHKRAHCSIQLRALNNTQLATIFTNIQSRYTIKKARKLRLSVFMPTMNDYLEDDFYIPDPDITIDKIENGVIKYEPVTLEFIGY